MPRRHGGSGAEKNSEPSGAEKNSEPLRAELPMRRSWRPRASPPPPTTPHTNVYTAVQPTVTRWVQWVMCLVEFLRLDLTKFLLKIKTVHTRVPCRFSLIYRTSTMDPNSVGKAMGTVYLSTSYSKQL